MAGSLAINRDSTGTTIFVWSPFPLTVYFIFPSCTNKTLDGFVSAPQRQISQAWQELNLVCRKVHAVKFSTCERVPPATIPGVFSPKDHSRDSFSDGNVRRSWSLLLN
jgi:hypothetical protein